MNCIFCCKSICTTPGDSFTPHYKREGNYKCKDCGPFKRHDLMAQPFAIPRNAIVSDCYGNYHMFANGKWRFVDESGISDYGTKTQLTNLDNLAPYTIHYERNI